MVALLQSYKPTLYYHVVNWKLTEMGWIKCNTGGASKGNPRQSSYGFYIRNHTGELLYVEAQSIGVTTNIDAESMAIWKALQYCLSQGFEQVSLETNSLTLKNILVRNWKTPWELVERVEDIQEIMSHMDVTIKHIFRKVNQLADYIANVAINKVEKQQSQNFNKLPITLLMLR
ncbi:hypothetical protein KY290_005185 [Solanum tuberosum]|uniref:RNase H type-1 domain-containing protein n=1 Tax=Solanum tuberosum TaxID=4113 RepID=A0ABQ7WDH5_SOLTU|nr:hypothetical protein KY289_005577 [Solanum tuberosum]KAH0751919.1 hypothetical protein KY285_005067 [Solanum tuberosum]KAH0778758.1 hypothetical protein KY290_005185 [Solanum tuberosum]